MPHTCRFTTEPTVHYYREFHYDRYWPFAQQCSRYAPICFNQLLNLTTAKPVAEFLSQSFKVFYANVTQQCIDYAGLFNSCSYSCQLPDQVAERKSIFRPSIGDEINIDEPDNICRFSYQTISFYAKVHYEVEAQVQAKTSNEWLNPTTKFFTEKCRDDACVAKYFDPNALLRTNSSNGKKCWIVRDRSAKLVTTNLSATMPFPHHHRSIVFILFGVVVVISLILSPARYSSLYVAKED